MDGEFRTYLLGVERFFFITRMSGFMLSAKDCEKVRLWYVRGIPLRVVLDGIAQGVRAFRYKSAPRQALPHNLTFYSRHIGAKVRAYRSKPRLVQSSADHSGGEDLVELMDHVVSEAALICEREARETPRSVKQQWVARLGSLRGRVAAGEVRESSLEQEMQLLDEEILLLYHERLEPGLRRNLEGDVESGLARFSGLGRKALQGKRQILLRDRLREELSLPKLWE